MLRILRQMSPEELRQVSLACGAPPGTPPEEIVRCLSRLCGATTWGIFPASTDDALLDQAGRRLGLPPMTGGPRAVVLRERALLVTYVRRAWEAAPQEQRREVLGAALAAWETPSSARPELPGALEDDGSLRLGLETLLQRSSGCRALAVALEQHPLPLPSGTASAGPFRLVPGRGPDGHQALYGALLAVWRTRTRLLRERQAYRSRLEQQVRQFETLLAARHRDLVAGPDGWPADPASGLSVAAAAGASAALHFALGAATLSVLVPAGVLGAVGLAWSAAVLARRARPGADRRLSRLGEQIQTARQQLQRVERDIFALDAE